MLRRQCAAHPKKRPTLETLEIEWRTRRIAENFAGESIVDPTAPLEMAKERNRIAEEPGSGTGDRRDNREIVCASHPTQYASDGLCVPITAVRLRHMADI